MYWNSVSTFGAHLHFQYHSCEEIVYFSRDFSTAFIHNIQYTEVTANQLKSNRCFHCSRLKSMYWNSVSTFGALLQFQYHSCEEIVYLSRDFSTAFIHNSQYTVSCKDIVYFSRDFSTAFIHNIQYTEVTPNQLKSNQCIHCSWNSVSTFGAHLHFQYHSCEEIVYFSMHCSTAFIHKSQYAVVSANQMNSYRCFHCTRLESMYWNSVSTIRAHLHFQYHSCEDIVFFQGILVLFLFNISNITKSWRTSWSQTYAFIVQDSNRCTDIQYPLLGHIFNFSTNAVKR